MTPRATLPALKGVTIAGPQSTSFAVDALQRRIVRVTFRPGGAYPFVRVPLSELQWQSRVLWRIFGDAEARALTLAGRAQTPEAIFELLAEAACVARRCAEIHPAISGR